MDWLRRNWPDLLIGIALVAVIAGIIATLISGGSFFPVGQGSRATTPTTQSGSASPGSASASSQSSPSAGAPSASTPAASTSSATEPGQAAGEGDASSGAVPAAPGDAGAAATPAASTPGASTPAGSSASSASPADAGGIAVLPPSDDAGAGSSPATPVASTPSTSTPAASSTVAPASSVTASATPDEESYRVSVGAFGNMENAARLAETFRSAGYPVLMGAQGNLNIVLVGPYATEDEARAVASRIRGGDFGVNDPTVYRFDPAEASNDGATTSPPAASGAAAPAAASSPSASAAAPASTAGRYLQVGAYATRESSLPQRERLEQLGFSVSERVENDLVKLLVGPFDGAALNDAQGRLEAAGIESFAR